MSKEKTVPAYVADAYLKALTIYGYDNMHHEKYYFSVDYFIDNYKDFAKDGLTFRLFHSEQERDEYARNSVMEDADNLDLMLDAYMDSMKEINLDKA